MKIWILTACALAAYVGAEATADYDDAPRNYGYDTGYGKGDYDDSYDKGDYDDSYDKGDYDDSYGKKDYDDGYGKRNGYGKKDYDDGYGKRDGYGKKNYDDGYGKRDGYGKKDYDDGYGKGNGYGKSRGYKPKDSYTKPSGPASYDGYPSAMYKNSPYRTDYDDKIKYTDGYAPRQPTGDAPYPTIQLEDDPLLRLPSLDSYHCFLSGAPWTNCGGRSLRDYFLDQCFSFYYAMTTAADGICIGKSKHGGGDAFYHGYGTVDDHNGIYGYDNRYNLLEEEGEVAEANYYKDQKPDYDGYKRPKSYKKKKPSYKPKKPSYVTPTTPPHSGDTYCDAYQEEKCLQSQYVSITLATVQCLTENAIRIIFIEQYAAAASSNPIEGPILYLKKLHQFIGNVISCQPDKIANYPTLWRRYANYNPTAPYSIYGRSNRVQLPRCTSNAASGWSSSFTNTRVQCNNIEDIFPITFGDFYPYFRDAGDITYDLDALASCTSSVAYATAGFNYLVKKCYNDTQPTQLDNHGQTPHNPLIWTNPDTLFGLLDGSNTITNKNDASIRVRTIVEIAANNAGLAKQPILEGNGVLYYCAFYACRANNGGDASNCFPGVTRDDWDLLASNYWIPTWNALTDEINTCLANGFLTAEDVKALAKPLVDEINGRTHICMAENEIVSFYLKINGKFDPDVQDGHIVFLRRLANEKCYLEFNGQCRSNQELYTDLFKILKKLNNRCLSNRFGYEDNNESEPQSYSEPKPHYDDYEGNSNDDYEGSSNDDYEGSSNDYYDKKDEDDYSN
ncbi:hypothetical protein THRCLA_00488 [Thraustotheca clavata]|uniref:Secreted protein n=1 Tax=Thraustotheca clavata TaxID=74557 RepID=A0A0A7CLK4_9STRA|nr:secreted protein [Thraustotheca clavata]OQS07499.1 hypothetical protein THRCLA_00488 [Thraustotheca clavata]